MSRGLAPEDVERIAERRERVAAMTRSGRTAADIAAALRVSDRVVVRDRRALGISKPPPPPPTPEQIQRASELLDDGCSLRDAATTVGCSAKQLSRRFPGRGWKREQISEYAVAMRRWRLQAQRRGIPA